jgi:hypothetical protein
MYLDDVMSFGLGKLTWTIDIALSDVSTKTVPCWARTIDTSEKAMVWVSVPKPQLVRPSKKSMYFMPIGYRYIYKTNVPLPLPSTSFCPFLEVGFLTVSIGNSPRGTQWARVILTRKFNLAQSTTT